MSGCKMMSIIFISLNVLKFSHFQQNGCQAIYRSYRQFSNIRCTQTPNIYVSRLVLQLSLPNPLKPGVKLGMKMQLEQRQQAMLQLHLNDQQFYCLIRCALY